MLLIRLDLEDFMKIITNNRIYVQKKDLELILKATNNEKIPNNIIERYKEKIDLKDLEFIFFEVREEIDFLNSFWFIIRCFDKGFTKCFFNLKNLICIFKSILI